MPARRSEFDAQVEIRGVDTDEDVRAGVDQGGDQALAATQQFGQAAEHFDQPHHRETLHGEIGSQALRLHQRTTHANELGIGMTGLEGLHEAGA